MNGKQHGKGKYKVNENTIKLGLWEDGKRKQWVDNEDVN